MSRNQRHRLRPRPRILTKSAKYGRCNRSRSRLFHAAQSHAGVFGFYDDHDTKRLQLIEKRVRDFRSQTLLQLQTSRKGFRETRQFRDAENISIARNVRDMTLADEWRQMMLAQRSDRDVFN